MVAIMLRVAIAIVALAEAASLFVGAALHLGMPVPAPFSEPVYLPSAVLEAGAALMLGYAALGIALRKGRAWQLAVAAHVLGVAAVVFGIGARATGRTARVTIESGHHPKTLLVLILVLVVLSLPPCRRAIEGTLKRGGRYGRYRRRRRRSNASLRL